MVPALSPTEPEGLENTWPNEPLGDANTHPVGSKRTLLRSRIVRSLITFCMGVAATLGLQSHGDAMRQMIASLHPQLAWLAPESAFAKTSPETAPTTPATASPDWQEFKSILLNFAAVRESVDRLALGQQRMEVDIANLKAAEQDILGKMNSAPPPEHIPLPAPKRPAR